MYKILSASHREGLLTKKEVLKGFYASGTNVELNVDFNYCIKVKLNIL